MCIICVGIQKENLTARDVGRAYQEVYGDQAPEKEHMIELLKLIDRYVEGNIEAVFKNIDWERLKERRLIARSVGVDTVVLKRK